jgi:hypothetical protein
MQLIRTDVNHEVIKVKTKTDNKRRAGKYIVRVTGQHRGVAS